jgi:hypothetical protein
LPIVDYALQETNPNFSFSFKTILSPSYDDYVPEFVPLPLAQANQYGIKKQGGIGGVLGNTFFGGWGRVQREA